MAFLIMTIVECSLRWCGSGDQPSNEQPAGGPTAARDAKIFLASLSLALSFIAFLFHSPKANASPLLVLLLLLASLYSLPTHLHH